MPDSAHAHEARLRVRFAETDQMGVVYHANYLIWMEVGRVEYCRAAGVRYRDMEAEGVLLTVVEVRCRYASSAKYDDEVIVKTWIETVNPRMIVFGYEMREADANQVLATGETKHFFCGKDGRPRKLPEQYRPLFGL
ncbi:MAG: thioesterase family protein [Bryobacteraceae bacterium]